jgi:gliding motility-associated-like protein
MKHFYSVLFAITIFLGFSIPKAHATHIAGGDISVDTLGNGQYLITLNLFRDCAGIGLGNTQTIRIFNPCTGTTTNFTAQLQNPGGTNISQLCATDSLNSSCFPGGTLPGMQRFTYQVTVTFNPICNDIRISWSQCCRNNAIVNLTNPGNEDMFIVANYNALTNSSNNTPYFTAQPIPYVCVNQLVNYSYGVVEDDGDSLVYSLVGALRNATTQNPYAGGYSPAVPIPGITINPQTGQISFTPNLLGNFVVVVQVDEYDSQGNLLSQVRRDIQFVVINCINNVPDANGGQITNLTGTGSFVLNGNYGIELCEGSSFSFTATFSDPDATDSLRFTTNLLQVLPGAQLSTSGANPATITIDWTAPAGSSGSNNNFFIQVNDGACPVVGIQNFIYNIQVNTSTVAGPAPVVTVCNGEPTTITAAGGNVFTWFDMLGNQVPVSASFSCNPCANPVVTTTTDVTYYVESDLPTVACVNRDTISIVVGPNYDLEATASSLNPCAAQPVTLNALTNIPGTYTYNWTPTALLSNPAIQNPVASLINPGSYTFVVTANNQLGCVKTDTITINVSPFGSPDIDINYQQVCAGLPLNLNVNYNNFQPTVCAATNDACNGPSSSVSIGSGFPQQNTSTAYPAPYGNFFRSARQQYLFLASELNAQGVTAGKINKISFTVNALNNSTTVYKSYTISMGCTNLGSLPATFQGGLSVVFNPVDYTVSTGVNEHVLDNFYDWDGVSNLIVEVCYDNSADPNTENCSSPFMTTAFTSSLFAVDNSTSACNSQSPFTATSRPFITFDYCAPTPSPSNYSFFWTPTANLVNPNSFNPTVLPNGPGNYQLVFVDNVSGCADTANVSITYQTTPFPIQMNITDSSFCSNEPPVQFSPTPTDGVWSGNGISSTGLFNPSTTGNGTFPITYSIAQGTGCANQATVNITVANVPNPAIVTQPTTICASQPAFQLQTVQQGGVWSGPGIAVGGFFNPSAAGTGTHTIVYSFANPCPASDSIVITVLSAPIVNIAPQSSVCLTSPVVNLSVTVTGGLIGTWSGPGVNNTNQTFDPAAAGVGNHTVTYSVTDPNSNCVTTQTIQIEVVPQPNASFTAPSQTLCSGTAAIQLTPQTPGGTFTGNGVTTGGIFTPSGSNLGPNTITYNITASGCTGTGTQVITVNETPAQPTLTIPPPVCEGLTVSGIQAAGVGTIIWYLNPGSGFINSGNELGGNISEPATIYVIDSTAAGCTSTPLAVSIAFLDAPTVSFTANPTTGDAPLNVSFTSNMSNDVTSFSWDFADGSPLNTTQNNPVHIFDLEGQFNTTLTVTNDNGCQRSASVMIDVELYVEPIIPNVFTPGGDGNNDVFKFQLKASQFESFKAVIYDRWGKYVTEFNSVNDTWDGSCCSAGTYYYIIDAVKKDGTKFTPASGFVRLVK